MSDSRESIWIVFHAEDGTASSVINVSSDYLGYHVLKDDSGCGVWAGMAHDALDAMEKATEARLARLKETGVKPE